MIEVGLEIDGAPNGWLRRGTEGSAGYDIAAGESFRVWQGARYLVKTGLRLAIPAGYVGLIRDRSGVALNTGLMVVAGVIDSDYRGEVRVLMHNAGAHPVEFDKGERIAQILFLPVPEVCFVPLRDASTVRGEGGFGSTGA